MRSNLIALAVGLMIVPAGLSQTTSNSSTTGSLQDNQPSENVRSSAVHERAPGNVIDLARTRHNALADARLAAQRAGDTSVLAPVDTGSSSSSSPLGNLINNVLSSGLLSSLSSTGGLAGLADAFGISTNSSTTSGSTSATTNSSTTAASGSNIPSNIPPEALAMIQAAGIDVNSLFSKSINDSTDGTTPDTKTSVRAQTSSTDTTTQQDSFRVRWSDAMLSTLFTALVVGFQTSDFVDLLAGWIRPIFIPANPATTTTTTDTTTNGNNSGDTTDGTTADPNSVVMRLHMPAPQVFSLA